ncbi:MAG: DUF2071 domain-containing protein [Puniceicoccaceae bacterium]
MISSAAPSLTNQRPVMFQSWLDLLFFHWQVPVGTIQQTLPDGLRVHTYEGRAFLSIVAFTMRGLRPRSLPAVGRISNFLELNLRTYVVDEQGRPGVWFYSLDADSWISVEIARRFFHLPYEHARLAKRRSGDALGYHSHARRDPDPEGLQYRVDGIPDQGMAPASPESLAHFWVERYRLFAYDSRRKRLWSGAISHKPYDVVQVEPRQVDARLMQINGFAQPASDLEAVYYSPGVHVSAYRFQRS